GTVVGANGKASRIGVEVACPRPAAEGCLVPKAVLRLPNPFAKHKYQNPETSSCFPSSCYFSERSVHAILARQRVGCRYDASDSLYQPPSNCGVLRVDFRQGEAENGGI